MTTPGSKWRKWFAWKPVFVEDNKGKLRFVFFKTIERRETSPEEFRIFFRITDPSVAKWEYRFPNGRRKCSNK